MQRPSTCSRIVQNFFFFFLKQLTMTRNSPSRRHSLKDASHSCHHCSEYGWFRSSGLQRTQATMYCSPRAWMNLTVKIILRRQILDHVLIFALHCTTWILSGRKPLRTFLGIVSLQEPVYFLWRVSRKGLYLVLKVNILLD